MQLGAVFDQRGNKVAPPRIQGQFVIDEDDLLLIAMLADPIYAAELLWDDPANLDYKGCYRVRDYQYRLFRPPAIKPSGETANFRLHACARKVGKSESQKAKAFTHPFRRHGEDMLVTAPELIHLLPLTDSIEDRIRSTRITRELLDTRGGKSGFTHRPFGVAFLDGTNIIGRIPRLGGQGVKGVHVVDLLIDEGQDYPQKGYTEVHEVVDKNHKGLDGELDFEYLIYGVHSGARDSGFFKRARQGGFETVTVTALQRPGWGQAEKNAAIAAYGGTGSPDYRRNILGEPGAAASQFFVMSRLLQCVDQDRSSLFNEEEYRHIEYRGEEIDALEVPIVDIVDVPRDFQGKPYRRVWAGMDVGLTDSPTVISLFEEGPVKPHPKSNAQQRLRLFRRYTLNRFRPRDIRSTLYAIATTYGNGLMGFGMDVTGLGYPMWQEMEDDEAAPKSLMEVSRGYFFNAKVPVAVDKEQVSEDSKGNLRDQYGAMVREEVDPLTNQRQLVTYMTMIEASTRYLREMVDRNFLMLPFDPAVTSDMLGETHQRVKSLAGARKKASGGMHILDSFRAMAQVYSSQSVEKEREFSEPEPVLDLGSLGVLIS